MRVARAFQRVNARAAQLWPEALEEERQGENLSLHILVQCVELRRKLVADLNHPAHMRNMVCNPYSVKYISWKIEPSRRS
jgi:hypothetical protein